MEAGPREEVTWYLWNSTIRIDIESRTATSFAVHPSARRWRTWR